MLKIKSLFIIGLLFTSFLYAKAQNSKLGLELQLPIMGIKYNKSNNRIANVTFTPLYKVNNNLSLGVGGGYMVLMSSFKETKVKAIPVYVYGRWKFNTTKQYSFFVSTKLGYSNVLSKYASKEVSGGLYNSVSLGVMYQVNNKIGVYSSLSHELQPLRTKINDETMQSEVLKDTNRGINLNLGLAF